MLFHKKRENILNTVNKESRFLRVLQFLIGVMILASAFNLFILPCNIVYGMSGIGVILNKATGISPSVVILAGNIILLIVSFIILGVEKTRNTILGSLLYPLFVELTAWMPEYIEISMNEPLLVALFGAVIYGFGAGLVFKSGFTTGGTDILNQIVSKYGKMSLGNAMIFTDGLIILFGIFVFGVTKAMYSIINLYIVSLMTDKIMIGISSTKSFFIITDKEEEIKEFIMDELGHGVTVLKGEGAFSGHKQSVLMCVIPTREYMTVKEGIHKIDKDSFFVVSDAYEVNGNK